jgi:hypothetical protein
VIATAGYWQWSGEKSPKISIATGDYRAIELRCLDLSAIASQTENMAHIYFSFDFGTDEEKAQQARHKLEMWKQAFRLDKKMLYKFERESDAQASSADGGEKSEETEKAAKKGKSSKAGKSKSGGKKKEDAEGGADVPTGNVKLYLRLAFSGHEKMTEERLLKRIPSEEPFSELLPKAVKDQDADFAELEAKFDSLD